MSLDVSRIGFKTQPHVFRYDWKTTVLYALGVGAKREELDYLYEGRGPLVVPTFAVIPTYPPMMEVLTRCGCDLARLLHGGQSVWLRRALPSAGEIRTVGILHGIYDMKRLAQVVVRTESTVDGEPCFETEWQLLVRDAGGFGGERPPKNPAPKPAGDAQPFFNQSEPTLPEQALLYRLTGDVNPLHADPAFASAAGFDQGPILHGLCTYGFMARAVIRHACAGRPERLRSLHAQFRKPVWPGEAIRTEGYQIGDGRVALEAFAGERADPVVTSAWAEVAT